MRVIADLRFLEVAAIRGQTADRAPLVIARPASAAEAVNQTARSSSRDGPRIRQRRARFVQERDDIHRAIDRAHLASDDVRHGAAVVRGRLREIGRLRGVEVVRLERIRCLLVVGAVEILDARCHGAIDIERLAEAERLRLAFERRLVRAAHHGTGDGVVDDGELRGGSLPLHADFDDVTSEPQILEAHDERCGGRCRLELGVRFAAVHRNRDVGSRGRRGSDLDQHVPPADHLGTCR